MAVARVSMMAFAALFCAAAPRALAQGTTSSTVTVDDDTGSPSSGDVAESSPPNATSPAVELGAICDHYGYDAHYFEEMVGTGETMFRYAGSDTGCPNHVNWALSSYEARVSSTNASIPVYPKLITSGATTLSDTDGHVAILFNGVGLYSSFSEVKADSYEESAFYLDSNQFDPCGGLADENGVYHHHSTPGCLQEQAMAVSGTTDAEHSPQLGWAYDGFPVYGQLGPGGIEMLRCGASGADDTYCLDACSGYEGEVAVDDFKYRYYTSCGLDDAYFPFTVNCYKGCCPDGVPCSSPVQRCDESFGNVTEDGYTDSYSPETGTDLSEVYDTDLLEGNDTNYVDTSTALDCSLYLGTGVALAADDEDSGSTLGSAPSSLAMCLVGLVAAKFAFTWGF